ncbi:MAG: VOC family protein [Hyphomicrobium sp.]|nr:VOC family protein [Hyphomicrobium sp.]
MARKMFVNLPVKDLPKSIAFFTKLGLSFNPKFTDETATCMLIGDDSYAMLLTEARFKDFTKKSIADTSKSSEVLIALSCEDRAEVDTFVDTALKSGGTIAMPPSDLGFMYTRTFYDLDGHHWEIFHMDPAVANG